MMRSEDDVQAAEAGAEEDVRAPRAARARRRRRGA